jgi:hypothetical protein
MGGNKNEQRWRITYKKRIGGGGLIEQQVLRFQLLRVDPPLDGTQKKGFFFLKQFNRKGFVLFFSFKVENFNLLFFFKI